VRKYRTVYDEAFIVYWPIYSISLIALVIISSMSVVALLIVIYILICNSFSIAVVLMELIVLLMCGLAVVYLLRHMFTKVTITYEGVCYENTFTKEKTSFEWSEVDTIECAQNYHFAARTVVKVFLKVPRLKKYTPWQMCDFVLLVSLLQMGKVLQFIPKELRSKMMINTDD